MLPDFSPSHTSRNIAVSFYAYFKWGVFLLTSIISLSFPVSHLAPVTVSLRDANPRHGFKDVFNHGLWSRESCKKQQTTGKFFPFGTKGYCNRTTVLHRGIMGWECQALPLILPLYTQPNCQFSTSTSSAAPILVVLWSASSESWSHQQLSSQKNKNTVFQSRSPYCLCIPLKYLSWTLAMETWPSKELPTNKLLVTLKKTLFFLVLKKFQSLPCLILLSRCVG